MNDVTKDLLEALVNALRPFTYDSRMISGEPILLAARAAIARAEAALATSQPDASMTREYASRDAELEQARAEEREACAKVCDSLVHPSAMTNDPGRMWIRGTTDCAAAIRAIAAAQQAEPVRQMDDSQRLDWIEQKARESRTGVSFDFIRYREDGRVIEHGYRVMWHHHFGQRFRTLREAIDSAREVKDCT